MTSSAPSGGQRRGCVPLLRRLRRPQGLATSASGPATSASITSITWSAAPFSASGPDPRQALTDGPDPRPVLIGAFEKQHPDIRVSLVPAPPDTGTNRAALATQISGGSATPDVFTGDVTWPGQFGADQLALPLSEHLPPDYWSQFAAGLVQGASYQGKVYGSPLLVDQGFLYYRKDVLAKAGMPPPTAWEQLMSQATTLVRDGLVKYGFVWQGTQYEGLTCNFMEYLASAGGTATTSDCTRATLNSAAATKAVEFMRALITSGATPPAVTTFEEPQAMNVFAGGNAAFLRNWGYAYSASITPAAGGKLTQDQVGVAPLPAFGGQQAPGYSCIGGSNMYINPHSKNLSASLTFIRFLTSPQAQTILATQFSEIPATTAARNSPTVKALNPVLAIIDENQLVPRPAGTPSYPALSASIYENVNAAVAGSMSPSGAIATAQSQAETALSSAPAGP